MVTLVIIISVLFSASAQLLLKKGMAAIELPAALDTGSALAVGIDVFTNAWVITGVTFHVVALLTWLYVLKHAEVSYAYPFISLGFVFVLLAGYLMFGESLNITKVAGIGAIVFGIILLGRSPA